MDSLLECSRLVRKALKKAFPEFRFSVTTERFEGGDAICISSNDEIPVKDVYDSVKKYQYGANEKGKSGNFPQTMFIYVKQFKRVSYEDYERRVPISIRESYYQ